jgi:Lon protease-like protein
MTTDALTGDRMIAPVLLQPCPETEYQGNPPIHAVACLGRIVADQRLDDGRFLLLLRGLARARVQEEILTSKPYRVARVELLPDVLAVPAAEAKNIRRRLADLILPRVTGPATSEKQLRDLFDGEMPLGALCDCLGYQLPLPLPLKQRLLEEPDVATRARTLVDELMSMLPPAQAGDRKFPPDFSLN